MPSRAGQFRIASIFAVAFSASTLLIAQKEVGAHYELHESGRPRAIIFVHGFTGTAQDSWRADTNKPGFPTLLATDVTVKQANVFVASYSTRWTNDNSTIQNIADKLFEQISDVLADHKELVFICHSLGGLVVERMLIDHANVAEKTSFIQFYGTPHEGVLSEVKSAHPLLAYANLFGYARILPELRPGSDNAELVKLDGDWRSKGYANIKRFCAVEMRPTYVGGAVGGIVVPYFSAAYGCDSSVPIDHVDTDHTGMVKVSDRTIKKAVAGIANEAYPIFLRNYRDNPFSEWRTSSDSARDIARYFPVDCERTTSDPALPITFNLDRSAKEELLGATAELKDGVNIQGPTPNPLKVVQVNASTVNVTFGFNGLDRTAGNCPGGGHATVVVHPTIRTRFIILDGN